VAVAVAVLICPLRPLVPPLLIPPFATMLLRASPQALMGLFRPGIERREHATQAQTGERAQHTAA
jgi:hypothetical protein